VYEETHGADGLVSIDISPSFISNAGGLVAEARKLWEAVDRPNVMIKIPGTERTWPAIERCLRDGINVNITLLFSPDHYRNAAGAYLRALESRVAMGEPIDRVASAASLLVGSVDSAIDRFIRTKRAVLAPLRGLVAIANARLVYAAYIDVCQSARWKVLEARGAKPQRPLWVCTDTEHPGHSDVFRIESVVTAGTITALSPDALNDLRGRDFALPPDDAKDAQRVMTAIARGGISFVDVCRALTDEGTWGFARSMEKLLGALAHRRKILDGHSLDFFE
jgi:transaldolase/glucose-6-phosphate isomerase